MNALTKAMTEDELLTAITEAATYRGWRWHHVRRSDKALQMGHAGFPDLVLARKGDVLFLELKAERGKPTDDQLCWLDDLKAPPDQAARTWIIHPSQLDWLLSILE